MLLYRSLVVGLVAACFILLARHRTDVRVIHDVATSAPRAQTCTPPNLRPFQLPLQPAHRPSRPALPEGPTIIDVSPAMPHAQIASLIHLAPDEHIASFEDHHSVYTDVEVRGPHGDRRVLLLVH